ncbi:hypothetical protein BJ742DRAFT_769005 [Cladochytrium replicatum]|nr:hypothetical protein BJ742DRAFT_769005 [Cladochytrium replicatum]
MSTPSDLDHHDIGAIPRPNFTRPPQRDRRSMTAADMVQFFKTPYHRTSSTQSSVISEDGESTPLSPVDQQLPARVRTPRQTYGVDCTP